MTTSPAHLFNDPEYVQGQIESLRALIVALSRANSNSAALQEEGQTRLGLLRANLHAAAAPTRRLAAVDDCQAWLLRVTAQGEDV